MEEDQWDLKSAYGSEWPGGDTSNKPGIEAFIAGFKAALAAGAIEGLE